MQCYNIVRQNNKLSVTQEQSANEASTEFLLNIGLPFTCTSLIRKKQYYTINNVHLKMFQNLIISWFTQMLLKRNFIYSETFSRQKFTLFVVHKKYYDIFFNNFSIVNLALLFDLALLFNLALLFGCIWIVITDNSYFK